MDQLLKSGLEHHELIKRLNAIINDPKCTLVNIDYAPISHVTPVKKSLKKGRKRKSSSEATTALRRSTRSKTKH